MATREINTRLTLDGEAAFNDALKSANNNLKTLSTELSATSAEFADNANSEEALTAKKKILTATVDQQREKVRALTVAAQDAAAAYGEDSAKADKYTQQLNAARAALAKTESSLRSTDAALEKVGESSEEATEGQESAAAAAEKLGKEEKKAADESGRLSEALKTVGGAVAKAAAWGLAGVATGVTAATAAVTKFAVEEAKNGNPAFASLAENLDSLSAASASVKSALGGVLMPALNDLSSLGAAYLADFAEAIADTEGDTAKLGAVVSDFTTRGIELLRAKLPEYLKLGSQLLGGVAGGIAESLPELLPVAEEAVLQLLRGLEDAAPALGDGAQLLADTLLDFLSEAGPELLEGGMQMLADIISGIGSAMPELIPTVTDLVVEMLSTLVQNAPLLIEGGLELVLGVVQGLLQGIPTLVSNIPTLVMELVQAFKDQGPQILSIGRDIVTGIWEGISASGEWLYNKLKGWVGDVIQWIKNFLGIHSPSAVMAAEIGKPMAQGVVQGYRAELSDFNAFDFTGSPGAVGGGGRIGGGVTVTINAQRVDESTIDYIYDTVNRRLGAG